MRVLIFVVRIASHFSLKFDVIHNDTMFLKIKIFIIVIIVLLNAFVTAFIMKKSKTIVLNIFDI